MCPVVARPYLPALIESKPLFPNLIGVFAESSARAKGPSTCQKPPLASALRQAYECTVQL